MSTTGDPTAVRATFAGTVQGVGFREATRYKALQLGLFGWVRNADDGTVQVHAEGEAGAVETLIAFLQAGPPGASVQNVKLTPAHVEGHEQFATRGVSAGVFVVRRHQAGSHHFDLRLEVQGIMHSWSVPKGPSLDPAVKRLAIQVEDPSDDGGAIVWDRGDYEQGGRVPWPEALKRGHAVFVLHGERLRGGFALQRTRPGAKPQWLLIKRRDEYAKPSQTSPASNPRSAVAAGRHHHPEPDTGGTPQNEHRAH